MRRSPTFRYLPRRPALLRLPLRPIANDPLPDALPDTRYASTAAAAVALLVALAMQPRILVDDAAIELRYAARFASGAGMTFNHGESLLGFAHPLWTFLLGAFGLGGGSVEIAARFLGIAGFALTAALLVRAGSLVGGGLSAGLLAAALAVVVPSFRDAMLAGTGSALTVCLALAAFDFGLRMRPIVSGVLFGLAAFNSPAALALPVGLLAASWLHERQLPRRLLDFAVTTWLLLLAISLVSFGGVFALQRETGAPTLPPSVSFEIDLGRWLLGRFGYCLVLLAAARLLFVDRQRARERVAVMALAIGFAVELLARFLLNGIVAPSFELVTLLPPLFLLAAGTPGAIALGTEPYRKARVLAAATILLIAALPGFGSLAGRAASRSATNAREAFDLELRGAGRWLDARAHDDELVETASAWSAFALANDVSGVVPRPAAGASEQPAYRITWGAVADGQASPPVVPEGMVPLALFDAARLEHRELPWITILGSTKSRLARTGVRAFTLRDFDPPEPLDPPYGLQHVRFEGRDLFAHPPSGARFRVPNLKRAIELRFTPAFSTEVPPSGSDGVTFEIAEEGKVIYRTHLMPTDPAEPVRLRLVEARDRDETSLEFVTTPGPAQNAVYDSVYWRDVTIGLEALTGSAGSLQPPDS